MNARKPPFRGAGDIQRCHSGEPSSWADSWAFILPALVIALAILWARSQGWL